MGIEKLNMKISSNLLLPILLADAKRTKSRKQKLRKVENSGDRSIKDGDRNVFLPSDHSSSNCAERVEGTGASFESSVAANGLSGKVKLSDYQDNFECMHEIVADESCKHLPIATATMMRRVTSLLPQLIITMIMKLATTTSRSASTKTRILMNMVTGCFLAMDSR